jgi:hypothetical protein
MSSERKLRLVFQGVDNSQHAIKSVSDSLKDLRTAVVAGKQDLRQEKQAYSDSISVMRERGKQERLLSADFKANHSNFFRSVDVMSSVGRTALTVNSIFQNYNLTQLRVSQIQKEVRDSTLKLKEAQDQYGLGSVKWRQAAEQHNQVLEEQKRVMADLPAQYLTMGLSALYAARPIGQLTQKVFAWSKTAQIARQASGGFMGSGALQNMVIGAGGASLLGSGKLGRAGSLLGKGGLLGAVAFGGFAGGSMLGGQLLKSVYGEKEGEERYRGIKRQLGIDKVEDMLGMGDTIDYGNGVTSDNSINAGTINIYTNDVKTAEDLKRSIQQDRQRNSEG